MRCGLGRFGFATSLEIGSQLRQDPWRGVDESRCGRRTPTILVAPVRSSTHFVSICPHTLGEMKNPDDRHPQRNALDPESGPMVVDARTLGAGNMIVNILSRRS